MSISENRNIDKITLATTKIVDKFWGISNLKLFKNGENVTFTATLNGERVYVRATEDSRRSTKQIQSELQWVKSINESGLVVAHPINDCRGQLTQSFSTSTDDYHIAVFANAKGDEPAKSPLDNLFIAKQLGHTIGKLHHHSSPPKNKFSGRHKWYENIHVVEAEQIINKIHSPFLEEWKKCFNWWNELAKEHQLSLVHMDAHSGNFNIDQNGQVCLFDFDDCAWNFLSYDLAVAINGLQWLTEDVDEEIRIKNSFIESYHSQYLIEQIWIDRIDSFQRLRDIEMFAWSMRMYGVKEDKKRSVIDHYQKVFAKTPELI